MNRELFRWTAKASLVGLGVCGLSLQHLRSQEDLLDLLSEPETTIQVSDESRAAYEEILVALEGADFPKARVKAQAFQLRTDFAEPEQRQVVSTFLRMCTFGEDLKSDIPELGAWQNERKTAEQQLVILRAQLRQIKTAGDAMPKIVTSGGAAHTKILQLEQQYHATEAKITETEELIESIKAKIDNASGQRVSGFRDEVLDFIGQLQVKSKFREIVALAPSYSALVEDNPQMMQLAQQAIENEKAFQKSNKIVDAVFAKTRPLSDAGKYQEALEELEKNIGLITDKLRDQQVKRFTIQRLDQELGMLKGKITQSNARTEITLRKIGKAIEIDPWAAEKMLKDYVAANGESADAALLQTKITGSKRAGASVRLNDIKERLEEAGSCFDKISATFLLDVKEKKVEKLQAILKAEATRENFVRAYGLVKMASGELNAFPAIDLNPLQQAEFAGLKESTSVTLETLDALRATPAPK